jgi:predicted kinase
MQLVEYVNSLFEQGLSGEEVIAKTQEWKKKNNYGVSEQEPTSVLKEDLKPKEEEVKIEGAAKQTDATAPPKTPDASENLESGNGKSQSGLFSTYLQTGIDPFLNEDFKDVFKRSSGKELDKIYNEFEAQKVSNEQDGLGGQLEEVVVTAKRDPFSYSVIGEGLGLSGLLADSDNIFEQRFQQERLSKLAESKNGTTVANLIETGTISPLDQNSERGKDQNLYHNKSFFGKYLGGVFNYRGADVDDIKKYTRNVFEGAPYVLAMDYEGGVDFDYIAEEESLNQKLGGKDTGKVKRKRTARLNKKQIQTKINEIERTGIEDASGNIVYTPENKKKLEDLYKLKEDIGGDLFVPIDINEAYNYQINNQVDSVVNSLSDSKKASYLNKVKNQGTQQLSDEEKNIRNAELKIRYKLYENDEEKQKLEKYLVSKEEFYGKKLYDDKGNFIDFKKAKTESQIVEEASILSDDNDIDFLEDQLLKSNVKVVELSKALLELNEYKKQASFIGPDVKAGRLKGTLIEGSKLLSDKLSLKDNEVKLLEEIIKTGLIPEDYKYLSAGSRSSGKLNEALQEYQVLNTALQLNKNPLSVKNREYSKTFVNTVKEIGSYDYGLKTAPLRLRKDGMRAFENVLLSSGYSEQDVNYFSKNIENNFGENVIGGVVGLGNISIQLGALRGAGAFTAISKLLRAGRISSQMYFRARGMKWTYKPITHFFNGALEGTEFMALGATKNLVLDQQESLGGNFGFGFAMKAGGGLYTDLFKYFNKKLINTSLATPLAYLDDYASVRMFRQRSREAFGGSSSFMIGSAVTDPVGTYDRGFKDFMKHYGQEYVNMFMYGNMSRGLKTKGGSLKAARDAMENDFLGFSNYSIRAKNGANLLNIDKNIIQKPTEESNNIIDSKVENKIIEVNKKLENKEITENQAAKELIEIEEAQSAVTDQVIVNQVKSLVKERREADDYPSKGDVYRAMQKFSTGEKFDARDSEVFEKMSPEEILKSMGGEYSKENIRAIEQLQDRENKIQAIMNGGDMLVVKTEGGYEYIPPSTYKVIKSNKSLRNEVYTFLDKKLSLDSTIQRLQATDKSGMSPLEKEALENEIKELTKELDNYKEGGSETVRIQEKVNKAAGVEIEKSKAQDVQAQEKFPIITSKGESNVEYLPENQYKQRLKEAGVEGGENSTAVTLPNGTRLVNETKAKEIKDFSTGAHETAGHAVFFDVFKDNQGKVTEEGIKFIDSMLNLLPESQRKEIQLEVQDRYPDLVTEDKKEWYEENLAIMAEYMREGKIKYSESIGEKIRGIVPFMKRKGFDKLNIEKPEDAFKLMQGLTSGVQEAQKAASEASIEQAGKRLTEEAVSGIESKAEATFSLAKKDSDTVNKIFEEKGKNGSFEILELLRPTAVALARRFRNRPNYDEQLLVDEIMTGKRGMLDVINDYAAKVEKGDKVGELSLFLNNSFSTKTGFKRYIEIADRNLGKEFDQNIDDLAGLKEAPVAETTKEAPVEKIAKKPTETVEFSQAQVEKIGAKDKAEVETRITESTKEAFKGKEITRFGETRNVPKAVADIYAGMFGLNPQTITDKTRNYQKTDAEGLTTAKQFLLKNANNDFARLPKTKDGFGKGTFLPRNVMNALYTDGKLTGTLKDYMDLIRQKPTKPIYRDAVGQTIRGLLNLHIRNRMFEDLVTTTPERLRGGAKFSQAKITGKQKSGQERLDSKADPKALEETRNNKERKREILVNDFGSVMPNEIFRGVNFTMGNRIDGSFRKRGFDMITDPKRILNPEERKRALDLIEQNEILDLTSIKQDAKANEPSFTDAEKAEFKESLTSKAGKDYKLRLKNKDLHDKGVDLQLDKELEIAKKSPEAFAVLRDYMYNPNLNANSNRAQATNAGIEYGAIFTENGKTRRRESVTDEHVFQAIEHANAKLQIYKNIVDAEKSGDEQKIAAAENSLKRYKKWIKDNYIQIALKNESDVVKGNLIDAEGNSWIDSGGTSHPILMKALNKAIKSGKDADWDKIPNSMLRYFNGYKNKNGESASLNPNNLDVFGKNIAKDFNVEVDRNLRQNPNVVKKQGDLINKVILTEAGLLEGSNAVSREKAKQLLDNYLKTAQQETRQAEVNNNLQPNVLKMQGVKSQNAEVVISELKNLDNALNTGRTAVFSAPKKIRVFDFDDTLARSKSKVLYTVPNVEGGFSEGSTKLKAIFMVGGPGAGKTNVGKGLQLGRRGYKVVNQDIALEAMKKEAGLPAKESDYTAEQRSTRSKLGAAARKAAVAKFDKYAENGLGMVIDGTGASYNATTKKIKALEEKGYEVHMVVATTPLETAIQRNKARTERSLPDFVVKKTYESVQESLKRYRQDFGGRLYEINTESIEYGKPLPAEFLKQVYAGINTNKVGKINATEFAAQASTLESQGAEFDFREFSKVVDGKKGPLFSVAEKIAAARGTDDIFILTARPADAAGPIQEFMKANGIDLKLENIVGLGDGTAAAKGRWIAGKAAEGYNDFYFADDAVKNVQAVKDVLSQVDVKSKVQQAKFSKAKDFDRIFNDIIEAKTGIESYKQYSAAKAKTIGASKGKFDFFIPASAEDFTGLLYRTLGKGKVGDAQMAFYKDNLIDPYNRAEMAISQAKVAAGRDYKELKKAV